ncbi:MAG TPA: PEP-CTERM sorting domain-containing protein [Pirellulales bacterium]
MLRAYLLLIGISSLVISLACEQPLALAGPFAPAAGQPGSTAISKSDPQIVAWATTFQQLIRGPQNISNPGLGLASVGNGASALGPADGSSVVSLGDGGQITLGFAAPIVNGPGTDFAVFENGFASGGAEQAFLELGFVEVSSDGVNFFPFPSVSLTPTTTQVGAFGLIDATNLNDLAGKYVANNGTPFDLDELSNVSPLLDVNNVDFVRIIDVVGDIDPAFTTHDSQGNIVNDPWPTSGASSGFDLDAVGVIHQVPEPAAWQLVVMGLAAFAAVRKFFITPRQLVALVE